MSILFNTAHRVTLNPKVNVHNYNLQTLQGLSKMIDSIIANCIIIKKNIFKCKIKAVVQLIIEI